MICLQEIYTFTRKFESSTAHNDNAFYEQSQIAATVVATRAKFYSASTQDTSLVLPLMNNYLIPVFTLVDGGLHLIRISIKLASFVISMCYRVMRHSMSSPKGLRCDCD